MAAITVPIMHTVYLMRKKFMVGMFETKENWTHRAIMEVRSIS